MQKKILIFLFGYFVLIIPCNGQLIGMGLFAVSASGVFTTGNAVPGWTVESTSNTALNPIGCTTVNTWTAGSPEFSIVSTPVFGNSYIPGNPFSIDNVTIPNSPLGSNSVARLQDAVGGSVNGLATRLKTTFPVNSANSMFVIAFAGSWDGSGHVCCEQPSFIVKVYTCGGLAVNVLSLNVTPQGPSCVTGASGYSVSGSPNGVTWTNWQLRYIDLSFAIGSCATIEIISSDCTSSLHHGSVYLDCQTYNRNFTSLMPNVYPINPGSSVNLCSGSNQAQLIAPLGYNSYYWYAPVNPNPPILIGTSHTVNIPNPVSGTVYTVVLVTSAGYSYTAVDTIKFTTISILGIGSNSTSCGGATGSASVVGSGSGTGYNYNWYAPGNIAIGTSSTVSNLAAGIYTVGVSAIGSTACGSAVATVTVGTVRASTTVKYYCSTEAYLSATPTASNIQWYSGLSAISPTLGGTAQNYTVTAPYNNQFLWLSYNSSLSCRDSVKYILTPATPGTLSIAYNKLICPGATNGQAVLSMTPAIGSTFGANTFSVYNPGIFSVSPSPNSLNTFTVDNLWASNTYSVKAFDGVCNYTTILNANVLPPVNYTLGPLSSTVCMGGSVAAGITFSVSPLPGQYNYTWTPNIFLQANNANVQTTIITPTAALGAINNVVYAVAVSPTILNCPVTKTLTVSAVNFVTPTINPIPLLCKDSPIYTLSINPASGFFIGVTPGLANGVITPSLANTGNSNFFYSLMPGTCVGNVAGSFTVNPLPILSISGGTTICLGETTTLTASGANNFSWNTSATNSVITVSPIAQSSYSVTGTNTTGCSAVKTISVTVHPLPNLLISGNTEICEGEFATLTGSGADSYQWLNHASSAALNIDPPATMTFTLLGATIYNCSSTKTVVVNVSICTSINELNNENETLKVYPNPTDGNLYFDLPSAAQVVLYNEIGQALLDLNLKTGKQSIDLSSFKTGIYLLRILHDDKTSIIKIIKTN